MSSEADPQQSPSPTEALAELTRRVTALEELLTHTQQTTEELSREMFAQTRRVSAVHQELARLVHKMSTLSDTMPAGPRDPEAEKPPHY